MLISSRWPRWARRGSIVEGADPHENQVRTRFGFAEDLRAALRTETAMHDRAAIGAAYVVGQRSGHVHRVLQEARAHHAAARAEILTDAAPTLPNGKRRVGVDLEPHRPAQTPARNRQDKAPVTRSNEPYVKREARASNWGPRRDFAPRPVREG